MSLNFPDSPTAGTVFGAWRYDGVKWGAVSGVSGGGSAGDITAVLAGTGLSGGGTEGDVSIALASSPALTGNPTAPTPARGDNDTSIATTEFVATAIAQAANQTYYYDLTDNSDIATYKKLLLAPSLNAESNTATVCTGTSDVLMASFATDSGVPGAINYPAGSAYRRLYGKVSGGSAKFRLQILSRTPGGVETIVRDEYSPVFNDTTPTLVEWLATPLGGTILPTDRLVAKIYGQRQTGSPTNVTVTLYCEGTNNASQMQTTIPMGSQALVGVTPPLTMSGGNIALTSPLPIANGGTGASTTAAAPWVEVAGDTMTGALNIAPASGSSSFIMRKPASGSHNLIEGRTGANGRWLLSLGDDTVETGSGNTGSDFALFSCNDAGTLIDAPLKITRSNSAALFSAGLTVTGTLVASGNLTVGSSIFSNGLILEFNGQTGGPTGGGPFLYMDGTQCISKIASNSGAWFFRTNDGSDHFMLVSGDNSAQKPGGGPWVAPSGLDIKQNIVGYTRGLEAVTKLNPVVYSYNTVSRLGTTARYTGLIAEEVQPVMPEMVGSTTLNMPMCAEDPPGRVVPTVDTGPLIYALVNAVKELAARVAALEGAP